VFVERFPPVLTPVMTSDVRSRLTQTEFTRMHRDSLVRGVLAWQGEGI